MKEAAKEQPNPKQRSLEFAHASESQDPPNPPNLPDAASPLVGGTRHRLMVAVDAQNPPNPPKHREDRNPNRKYGFIVSVEPGSEPRTQRYSYLSESEQGRKRAFLQAHPEYEIPPGDPMNAPPKGAKFGFITTLEQRPGGHSTVETYWYTSEEERQLHSKIIRGV